MEEAAVKGAPGEMVEPEAEAATEQVAHAWAALAVAGAREDAAVPVGLEVTAQPVVTEVMAEMEVSLWSNIRPVIASAT
jgi:hypothetical protein